MITDLDNTLWDWFAAWHASFSSMLQRVSELSGVPIATLEPEIRRIHQERGTAEYSYLLNEVPSLVLAAGHSQPSEKYDEAVHAGNSARKRATMLYPRVRETLDTLRAAGVLIVAYTESVAYWTEWRIKHTGLDGVIDVLYSAPDHDLPSGVSLVDIRRRPASEYGLKSTVHRSVPRGALKPNVAILRAILEDCERTPDEAVYVGDSLMKDIAMAQAAGVLDVHAAYGLVQDQPAYEALRRVSHWTDADVAREKQLATSGEVVATVTLARDLSEILPLFELKGLSH
jgi:phosphoglycolate phosphatase